MTMPVPQSLRTHEIVIVKVAVTHLDATVPKALVPIEVPIEVPIV
jgi:hypothetical protein